MSGSRLAGVLWIVAGLSAGAIAFFITDPPTLAVFVIGALIGIVVGGLLVRGSGRAITWSSGAGVIWLIAFGIVTVLNLGTPIEELLSVVWILVFGIAAAVVAYLRRPATADA